MSDWSVNRTKPYTEIGIRRCKCIRCGAPAVHQWNICADAGRYRPMCLACDIALNRMVLEWSGHPQAKLLGDRYETEQLLKEAIRLEDKCNPSSPASA